MRQSGNNYNLIAIFFGSYFFWPVTFLSISGRQARPEAKVFQFCSNK